MPLCLQQAVSPHLAARWGGDRCRLPWSMPGLHGPASVCSWVTMEGRRHSLSHLPGGDPIWLPDLVQGLGLGCLLVAEAGLGTINQVGLTADYLPGKRDCRRASC